MLLALQPILVIGALWNDELFVAVIMATLAARFASRLLSGLGPARSGNSFAGASGCS